MEVTVDVGANIIQGKQKINYFNNSPDTLRRIFLHLYWNAFQPGSMMDISTQLAEKQILGTDKDGKPVNDADTHFKKQIAGLSPAEAGYCHVTKLQRDGRTQMLKEHETLLEVQLDAPLLPGDSAVFNTEFQSGIPALTRRSGRDSEEGIRYSIGQWYPKVCEYDAQGWHADDYIGREFYGVWGDFDVSITIDKNFKLGATGELQNANEIGWGYDQEGSALKAIEGRDRKWIFSAKNVHDFVWSADPGYKHITRKTVDGPLFHFIYREDATKDSQWQATADTIAMVYPFMAKTFGDYTYPVYSFLQGGGGGTEYPMATLVKDAGFPTALHEFSHSWYQGMMGTNENLYSWMDEGFANYAEARVFAWLHHTNFFMIRNPGGDNAEEYKVYFNLARSQVDEPMSTPANWFGSNIAYDIVAYYKGAIFLRQLGYIAGEANVSATLKEYYRQWRYKHPTPNDFTRVAEKVSGLQLQWYKEYMLNTTKFIDYSIDSLWEEGGFTKIRLKRIGEMPMPIDLELQFRDGSSEMHYVPLSLMFGEKPAESGAHRTVHEAWPWTNPFYILSTTKKLRDIRSVEIDPSNRMADVDARNNLRRSK